LTASAYPWAGGSLARTYQLSPIELGYLFSAYSWTYTVGLIPIGLMIDRWGTRLTPLAAMTLVDQRHA
jgi:MFS family permease